MFRKKIIFILFMFVANIAYANDEISDLKMVYLAYGSLIKSPGEIPIKGGFNSGGPALPVDFLRISGLVMHGDYFPFSNKTSASLDEESLNFVKDIRLGLSNSGIVYYGDSYCFSNAIYKGNSDYFSKIRLTLAIVPGDLATKKTVRSETYYAEISKNVSFNEARMSLARREGTSNIENIAYIKYDGSKFIFSQKALNMGEYDLQKIQQWMVYNDIGVVFWTYLDANFREQMSSINKQFGEWNEDNVKLFYNILYYNNKVAFEEAKNYLEIAPQNIRDGSVFWKNSKKSLLDYVSSLEDNPPSRENTNITYSPKPTITDTNYGGCLSLFKIRGK